MVKRVACIVGTRPEAIKMAPVILELKRGSKFEVTTVCSGQHKSLAQSMLGYFGIEPDVFFDDVMKPGQSLASLTSALISRLDQCFAEIKPDVVLVQGDTTTVLAAGLAAFYRGIKIGHVEAGLRTGNMHSPFPEEMNRSLIGRIADWHFCPTKRAAENLRAEGVPSERIAVLGNTVVDALQIAVKKQGAANASANVSAKTKVLFTLHRRESFGEPARRIFETLKEICLEHSGLEIVYPVHPNPNVHALAYEILGGVQGVRLVEPLDYPALVTELIESRFVLTDSGGLQEEAPSLGKPVLVLREETERPEVIECGAARLVGSDPEKLRASFMELLEDGPAYRAMTSAPNPFGDGTAARKIREILERNAQRETKD